MQMNIHQNIIIIVLIKTCIISHQTANGSNDSITKNGASGSLGIPSYIAGEKLKTLSDPNRNKRSPDTDEEIEPFWAQRGKRSNSKDGNNKFLTIDTNDVLGKLNIIKTEKYLRDDTPFWGNRGPKREDTRMSNSLRLEDQKELNFPAWPLRERRVDPTQLSAPANGQATTSKVICVQRYSINPKLNSETPPEIDYDEYSMSSGIRNERNDEIEPFWGNRGRRDDAPKTALESWKRKEDAAPFWGNRGRRDEDAPFWGNRGRRDDAAPFWGNRGRRLDSDDAPFWGNHGRRNEETPFWGNRGRRYEDAPFWGNRGRRDDETPFWGNRGRRYDEAPFWGSRRNDGVSAFDGGQYGNRMAPFWTGGAGRTKLPAALHGLAYLADIYRHPSSGVMTRNLRQDPLYVDEPSYVLLPSLYENRNRILSKANKSYIDSRGKKKGRDEFLEAARARRGILEEITRQVTSDPFYIARGKKDDRNNAESRSGARTFGLVNKIPSVKSVICSHLNLNISNAMEADARLRETRQYSESHNVSDRERRVILKKLTAELFNDPYFVSRGKKEDQNSEIVFQKLLDICSS